MRWEEKRARRAAFPDQYPAYAARVSRYFPNPFRAGSPTLSLTQRLSTRTLLVGGVMIVITSLFVTAEQDPDFWWHLRIGRWMVDNDRLPSTDLFTYTVPNHVWTDHEYLTEILMWLLYSAHGTVGIAIAFGVITWLGFWLMYRQVRRQPFVVVGVGLALAAVAGNPIWGPRAQMITFAPDVPRAVLAAGLPERAQPGAHRTSLS